MAAPRGLPNANEAVPLVVRAWPDLIVTGAQAFRGDANQNAQNWPRNLGDKVDCTSKVAEVVTEKYT